MVGSPKTLVKQIMQKGFIFYDKRFKTLYLQVIEFMRY